MKNKRRPLCITTQLIPHNSSADEEISVLIFNPKAQSLEFYDQNNKYMFITNKSTIVVLIELNTTRVDNIHTHDIQTRSTICINEYNICS